MQGLHCRKNIRPSYENLQETLLKCKNQNGLANADGVNVAPARRWSASSPWEGETWERRSKTPETGPGSGSRSQVITRSEFVQLKYSLTGSHGKEIFRRWQLEDERKQGEDRRDSRQSECQCAIQGHRSVTFSKSFAQYIRCFAIRMFREKQREF